jgi:hypothetical protein
MRPDAVHLRCEHIMRSLHLVLPAALLVACPSTPPADTGGDGGDAGEDGGTTEEGGYVTPQTEACTGASTACLSGSASTTGFTTSPRHMEVHLFRGYPSVGSAEISTIPVALDGTWAFSGVAAWDHYFVQVVADFGQPVAIAAVAGSLTVPSSTGPVAVQVPPVQLSVLQEAQPSGAVQLVSALAYVFDPSTGAAVSNATVAIEVGGAPQPLVWTSVTSTASAYVLKFPAGTAAQASYTVTTALSGSSSTSTWTLSSPTTSLSPTLTAPSSGGTVPAGQPLTVSWPELASDSELVELFTQQAGAWTSAYQSPPDDADVTQQTVPGADVTAGPLLINVDFLLGSCPVTSDGCVAATYVAASQVTAQ